jgi:hypothetical protein
MGSNEIGSEFINVEGKDLPEQDVTFLDIDPLTDGYLTFITMKNATKLIGTAYGSSSAKKIEAGNVSLSDDIWQNEVRGGGSGIWQKSRNQVKLGKLINKMFPDKFNDKQIEEFVNLFRATLDKTAAKFKLVEGATIDKMYDYHNYKERSGTLGGSCMRDKSGTGTFNIYSNNPQVCKMLVILEEGKVAARALVWQLNSITKFDGTTVDAKVFMDRQYTIRDSDVIKMRKYAEKNGWAYKSQNSHTALEGVVYKGAQFEAKMTVKLNPDSKGSYEYIKYPYLDTFRRYDPTTGIMYNDHIKDDHDGHYLLDRTDSGKNIIDTRVYSSYYDRKLTRAEAIHSEVMDDWILRDKARQVEVGRRRGLWPEDHPDVKLEEFINKWVHKDDLVMSDLYKKYILKETAIKIIAEMGDDCRIIKVDFIRKDDPNVLLIKEFNSTKWYQDIIKLQRTWRYIQGVLKPLMIQSNDIWLPKKMVVEVFKITPSKKLMMVINRTKGKINPVEVGSDYLMKVDATALGYDIIEDDSKLIDRLSYDETVLQFKDMLVKKLRSLVRSLNGTITKSKESGIDVTKLNDKLKWFKSRLSELSKVKKVTDINLENFKNWVRNNNGGQDELLNKYSEEEWNNLLDHFEKLVGDNKPW